MLCVLGDPIFLRNRPVVYGRCAKPVTYEIHFARYKKVLIKKKAGSGWETESLPISKGVVSGIGKKDHKIYRLPMSFFM